MEHLSAEKLHQVKEVFALYDEKAYGLVPVEKVPTMIRLMGINPTETEIEEVMEEHIQLYDGQIDFPSFLQLFTLHFCVGKSEVDLKRALRVFDRNHSGTVCESELRYALTTLGNVLPSHIVDDLMEDLGVSPGGEVDCDKLINKLNEVIF